MIYVWAMEQEEGSIGSRKFDSQDVFVPWNMQRKYLNGEKKEGEEGDEHIKVMKRYYHVFTESEFRELLASVPELRVDGIHYDSNNWAAEVTAL